MDQKRRNCFVLFFALLLSATIINGQLPSYKTAILTDLDSTIQDYSTDTSVEADETSDQRSKVTSDETSNEKPYIGQDVTTDEKLNVGEDETSDQNSEIASEDAEETTTVAPRIPAPEFSSVKFRKLNDKLTIFNELLDKELPPKGYPFPHIHGPSLFERVCIVGAGPAGVHMSLSLKKKGYTNVTIFEKTGRVGGKSKDINLGGGSYQPQGAFVFSSEYFSNLVSLAEEYGVGEYERIPELGVSNNVYF